ncbi:MAG: hypothetical protein A2X28_07255 [Elusimicrobia bacterium GWA2_56_46]|nr:MAG: hypothetical protein A2X28_07255 [Elusimicrobia bacterium GWA2_56_46]OGR54758.1 MAG: hypothetical protein A2X39_10735 [Elusimicrobia bacterium GWC2_56_31]HBB66016.1 hypothetical protein [Elusimicrobiota bacterium]HBW23452.1 hypothetical protein [Elusimicrobiota bacterium]
MTRFLKYAFLAALLLSGGYAGAKENDLTVSFKLAPPANKPKLAESFTIRLELTRPAAYSVRPDTAAFSNEIFSLLKIKKVSERADGALKTGVFELEAAAFDIGVSTFPEITWLLTAGAEEKQAKSPPFALEILPLFAGKTGQEGIRDISPPFKFIPWLWLLAGLAAAAAAAWFLYRRYKAAINAAASSGPESAPDLRSPYEKASAALAELTASGIWAEGRIKEFYSRLADIFRGYLDAQFAIKAELLTTNDITRELRRTGADIKTVIRTRELLESADLVKFARFRPGEKERDDAVASLKDLLLFFNRRAENAAPPAAEEGGKQ